MGKVPKRDHMEIRMDILAGALCKPVTDRNTERIMKKINHRYCTLQAEYRDLYGEFYTPKDL